jgi:PleD family two-component response regulator
LSAFAVNRQLITVNRQLRILLTSDSCLERSLDLSQEPRILVVEDSPTQSMYLKMLLQQAGYRVDAARDGDQGLQLAAETKPDLIISDVVMPQDERLRDVPGHQGQP